jgi:drug/metabolite transporter (DMT)-like permease
MPLILLASGQFHSIAAAPASTLVQVIASGALGYGLGDTLYITALNRLGMQRAFPVSMALYIALTVVFGVLLLGEPFSWGLPAGAVLIGAGIYLIVIPGSPADSVPAPAVGSPQPAPVLLQAPLAAPLPGPGGYALLAGVGITWAAATLWLAAASGELGAVAAGTIRTPAGAVALLGFALAFQRPALAAPFRSRRHLAAIALAGLVGTTIGSLLYVYAVVTAGAARTAILSSTSPLLALPLSIAFLGERLTRRVLAGTLLCVAGIVLVVT